MTREFSRRLVWIPVVHSQADLGSLSVSVKSLLLKRIGPEKWKKREETIEQMWRGVQTEVDGLKLNYGKVKLYQDGLPNCGRELGIVEELAKTGSKNHKILLGMVKKGAVLVGTESPELLREEYEFMRRLLTTLESGNMEEPALQREADARVLLGKRDRYIADRIDKTLKPGETGLVFLGVLHSLGKFIPLDIQVKTLGKPSGLKGIGAKGHADNRANT